MNMNKNELTIIGAGPSGLSLGYYAKLANKNFGFNHPSNTQRQAFRDFHLVRVVSKWFCFKFENSRQWLYFANTQEPLNNCGFLPAAKRLDPGLVQVHVLHVQTFAFLTLAS